MRFSPIKFQSLRFPELAVHPYALPTRYYLHVEATPFVFEEQGRYVIANPFDLFDLKHFDSNSLEPLRVDSRTIALFDIARRRSTLIFNDDRLEVVELEKELDIYSYAYAPLEDYAVIVDLEKRSMLALSSSGMEALGSCLDIVRFENEFINVTLCIESSSNATLFVDDGIYGIEHYIEFGNLDIRKAKLAYNVIFHRSSSNLILLDLIDGNVLMLQDFDALPVASTRRYVLLSRGSTIYVVDKESSEIVSMHKVPCTEVRVLHAYKDSLVLVCREGTGSRILVLESLGSIIELYLDKIVSNAYTYRNLLVISTTSTTYVYEVDMDSLVLELRNVVRFSNCIPVTRSRLACLNGDEVVCIDTSKSSGPFLRSLSSIAIVVPITSDTLSTPANAEKIQLCSHAYGLKVRDRYPKTLVVGTTIPPLRIIVDLDTLTLPSTIPLIPVEDDIELAVKIGNTVKKVRLQKRYSIPSSNIVAFIVPSRKVRTFNKSKQRYSYAVQTLGNHVVIESSEPVSELAYEVLERKSACALMLRVDVLGKKVQILVPIPLQRFRIVAGNDFEIRGNCLEYTVVVPHRCVELLDASLSSSTGCRGIELALKLQNACAIPVVAVGSSGRSFVLEPNIVKEIRIDTDLDQIILQNRGSVVVVFEPHGPYFVVPRISVEDLLRLAVCVARRLRLALGVKDFA